MKLIDSAPIVRDLAIVKTAKTKTRIGKAGVFTYFMEHTHNHNNILVTKRNNFKASLDLFWNKVKERTDIINSPYSILGNKSVRKEFYASHGITDETTIFLLERCVKLLSIVNKLGTQIKELERYFVHYDVFYTCIETFNKAIMRSVIDGYSFTFGHHLGYIYTMLKQGTRPSINYKDTRINKKKLIEEGKVPLKKWISKEGLLENNGGVDYVVYYSDIRSSLLIRWIRSRYTPNRFLYNFRPITSIIKELARLKDEKPELHAVYYTQMLEYEANRFRHKK